MGLLAQQSLSNSHKNNININFLTSSLLSWWLKWCSVRNHSGCAPTKRSWCDTSTSGFFKYPDTPAPRHIQISAKVSGY